MVETPANGPISKLNMNFFVLSDFGTQPTVLAGSVDDLGLNLILSLLPPCGDVDILMCPRVLDPHPCQSLLKCHSAPSPQQEGTVTSHYFGMVISNTQL